MSFTLEMTANGGPNGTYYDMTQFLVNQSVTVKMDSLDFTLIDPTGIPFDDIVSGLKHNLTEVGGLAYTFSPTTGGYFVRSNIGWTGTLVAVTMADIVELNTNHARWTCQAAQTFVMPTSFNRPGMWLSRPPSPSTDDYLLEDGSGHYLLEDGTFTANAPGVYLQETGNDDFELEDGLGRYLLEADVAGPGAYQMEGGSYGYSELSFQNRINLDGTTNFVGELTAYQPGLWPGDQFTLTSTNSGATGFLTQAFYVTQVEVRFPTPWVPTYRVTFSKTFGDVRKTWQNFITAGGT